VSQPLNIAHRGGRRLWPENTLYALEQAARMGADGAEIDVQLARDGSLVLFHDFRLKKELCRDEHGKWLKGSLPLIRDLTYAELSAFDVGRAKLRTTYGHRHGPKFPRDGEHIPLLRDAIAAVRAIRPDFKLFVEIKTSPEHPSLSTPPEAVAEAVVAELKHARFFKNAVLIGFDWPALIHAMKCEPSIECWFTTKPRPRKRGSPAWAGAFDPRKFGGSIPAAIAAAGGKGWLSSKLQATKRAIAEARAYGLSFGGWTVNAKFQMRALARLGADVIITDRPDVLVGLQRKDGTYIPSNSAVEV
jgi:glycerophosphoryl diester phosphodiesterase